MLRKWYIFVFFYLFNLFLWPLFPTDDYHTVLVKEGDTLAKIAGEHLENPRRWRELLQYNEIVNPNLIKPGMLLKIPFSLGKKVLGFVIFRHGLSEIAHQQEWKKAQVKDPIYPKSGLRTQAKAVMQAQFENSIFLRILPESEVRIQDVMDGKIQSVTLSKGKLSALIKEAQVFTVQTPAAVAAVRGTEFDTEVDTDKKTTLRCYEGQVEVTAQKKSVLVPAGFGVMVEYGKPPGELFQLPMTPKILKD